MRFGYLLLHLSLVFSCTADADELQVIISGKAIHHGSKNLNENNYGLGLQYDFDAHDHWIPLINMASLKDSNNHWSRYVGAGIKRRYRPRAVSSALNVDLGVLGLAMKRRDYNDGDPFFGAVPFVSFSNDWGGINATYIPAFEKGAFAFWYFQFSLKLMEF